VVPVSKTHGGKGDWIPGTNDKAYAENYPTIDWDARAREKRLAPNGIAIPTACDPVGCTCLTGWSGVHRKPPCPVHGDDGFLDILIAASEPAKELP